MSTKILNKEELMAATGESVNQLEALMEPLNQDEVNKVPYQDSWTAAQLFRHVSKSIGGLAQAIGAPAKHADRNPSERIPELEKTFLDFNLKMQSPEFIVPEPGPYNKQAIAEELSTSFAKLRKNSADIDLVGILEGMPFGPITKLEVLHFIMYHTQRHLNQMQRICTALKN